MNIKFLEKGQGLIEYALILLFIAVVVLFALQIFGPQLGGVFSEIATAINL